MTEMEWFRLGDALASYFESRNSIGVWYNENDSHSPTRRTADSGELNRCLSEASKSGVVHFRGVKVIDRNSPQNGQLEIIPTEYFRFTRSFWGARNEIEPFSGEESTKEFAAARVLGRRHPKWVEVWVERASFQSWLLEGERPPPSQFQAVPSHTGQVSESELKSDFNNWRSTQTHVSRDSIRQWGKRTYADRITLRRLDALDSKDAEVRPRKSGRRPMSRKA